MVIIIARCFLLKHELTIKFNMVPYASPLLTAMPDVAGCTVWYYTCMAYLHLALPR